MHPWILWFNYVPSGSHKSLPKVAAWFRRFGFRVSLPPTRVSDMATQAMDENSRHEPFFGARRDLDLAEQRQCAKPQHHGVSIAHYRCDRPGLLLTTPNAPMDQ